MSGHFRSRPDPVRLSFNVKGRGQQSDNILKTIFAEACVEVKKK